MPILFPSCSAPVREACNGLEDLISRGLRRASPATDRTKSANSSSRMAPSRSSAGRLWRRLRPLVCCRRRTGGSGRGEISIRSHGRHSRVKEFPAECRPRRGDGRLKAGGVAESLQSTDRSICCCMDLQNFIKRQEQRFHEVRGNTFHILSEVSRSTCVETPPPPGRAGLSSTPGADDKKPAIFLTSSRPLRRSPSSARTAIWREFKRRTAVSIIDIPVPDVSPARDPIRSWITELAQ